MVGYWIVRTYMAGAVGEKTKFWIPGARPSRSERRRNTEIKKQTENDRAGEKTLARAINANFGTGDVLLGLDYSRTGMKRLIARAKAAGIDWKNANDAEKVDALRAAADRELENVLRRVRGARKIEGGMKYIAITSDMDGDTGLMVRVHHHLLVPGEVKELFREKWAAFGGASWEPLRDQADYTQIAAYFCRQVRRIPDAKRYKYSRNLYRPAPKDRIANSDAELTLPRGGKLLHRNEYRPGQPQYIRYILPPAKQRRPEKTRTNKRE